MVSKLPTSYSSCHTPPPFPTHSRLAEREDKFDGLTATLQLKEEILTSLTSEKSKLSKEAQSKAAYHNQSLAQAKQQCTQLTEQLEAHGRREWELSRKIEDLQAGAGESGGTPRSSRGGAALGRGEGLTPARGGASAMMKTTTSVLTPPPTRSLLSDEAELRTENKKLKQELSCLQMNFQLTTQKSTQLRAQAKELETDMAELQNLFDKSLAEKEELQGRFDHQTEVSLRGQVGEQAKEAGRASELSEQVEKLRGELERLRGENRTLQEELESRKHALDGRDLISKLDGVKRSLTEEKLAMGGEMAALHTELEALQSKCRGLEDSTTAYREDKKKRSGAVNALKGKVTKLAKEKSELAERLAVASERLDRACDKALLHREETQALEAGLRAKDGKIAALSSGGRGKRDHTPEVEALSAKVAEKADELVELDSRNAELVRTRERLEGKVGVLDKTNARLLREGKHGAEMARKMTLELERLEETAEGLRAELESRGRECASTARLKLRESEEKLSRARTERNEEMAGLVGKLGDLEAHNLELEDLIACRQQQEEASAGKWRQDLEQKVLELEGKLDAAEFALLEKDSRASDLRCACELMEAENSTLLAQVTSLSEMVSTRNLKLEARQVQNVRQQSDVYEITERICSLEAEHGGCAGVISQLRDCNEALRNSLEGADSLKRELEGRVTRLEADVGELGRAGAVLKTENGVLQDEAALQDARNGDVARERADTVSRVRELERDLRTETVALSAAREELDDAHKAHRGSERERCEEAESLGSRVADLELRIEGFQWEKVELKSRLMGFRVEMREKDLLYSSLKIQRDSLSEQYESLKMSALSVLQSDADHQAADEEENRPTVERGKVKPGPKSILKKSRLRKVLHPMQDHLD